jgi:gamma-glutamyltranspeptidase/glutathione hydrolase
MSKNLSRQWRIAKAPVAGAAVVAAQNQAAADVGAAVLRVGGNAVDAAIATAFALGAVEPWMSGLGGIGFMTVWDAAKKRGHVVDFGPVSARRLDPADYPLTGRTGGDLFGWPEVLEDRNIVGYRAVAVPAQAEGMRAAHAAFGTRPWAELVAPAVELAESGLEADWFATLVIASAAATLAKDAPARAWFLPGGMPPTVDWAGTPPRLKNPALHRTLKRLAAEGARDAFEGEIARAMAADLARGGSAIDEADLAACRARLVAPLEFRHAGKRLLTPGGSTAGPALVDALEGIAGRVAGDTPDAAMFVAYAEALSSAYARRLGDGGDGCTTHLSVIDGAGNMVALTQTLLSLFGARVVLPETGIAMNNGINWFDPRPGRANSIGPGKRPLTNMLPTLGLDGDAPWLAIGASGGRRILPAVTQLVSFMADRGLAPAEAWHRPRIDVSGPGAVAADPLLGDDVRRALAERFATTTRRRDPFPLGYACPVGVVVDADGTRLGLTEIAQPWAGAAAA